uniref:F-box only protein 25 n=1 Tax=Schistocephalus solidus TaxID=70667 RepID=A0A0X3PS20_SCHSO
MLLLSKGLNNNILLRIRNIRRIYRQSLTNEKLSVDEFKSLLENVVFYQPHIYLNMNVTREVTITSTITDALIRLDMKSAVHDIRRFNYVCKLVKYLLMHRLHTLSGRSQIYLIELLKVIMNHVLGSFNQMSIFRELLETLKASLEQHNYEHIGSSQLWNNHWEALKLMSSTLENFDIQKSRFLSNPGALSLCFWRTCCQRTMEPSAFFNQYFDERSA